MMYWHSSDYIEAAAMDGSQHHILIRSGSAYIQGLAIHSKGKFYRVIIPQIRWCNNNVH